MSLFSYIKAQVAILDIIMQYVTLRQMGNYWKGPCPFHNETDASFTVSPDKGIFYCFGCHAGGDVISFIQKSENLQPHEAVQHMIERFKINVPQELLSKTGNTAAYREKKNDYFTMCAQIALWAHENLLSNKAALEYLNNRGIGTQEIEYFQIGYFKSGVRSMNMLTKKMAQQAILTKDLLEAGILVQGRSVLYSPFEERIIFPIKDGLGRHCGFGGRVFKVADKRAKYYNSRESDWFSKGKLLFGLDAAKKTMQKTERAFLVEGYTDCVAMVKAGYQETVATLGTACTQDHLKALSRYVQTLYVVYDGDAAGKKAIMRLTGLCWDVNLNLRVLSLPAQDDPATFVESGGNIQDLIDASRDIFTFYVNSMSGDFLAKTLAEKLEATHKIMEIVAQIGDAFKQDLLLQEAASIMQVPFDSLKKVLAKHRSKLRTVLQDAAEKPIKEEKKIDLEWFEEKLVASIINSLTTDQEYRLEKEILACFSDDIAQLLQKVETFRNTGEHEQRFQAFVESLPEDVRSWVVKICIKYDGTAPNEFEHLISMFRKKNWKHIVQNLKVAIVRAKQNHDTQALDKLMSEFMYLKQGIKDKGLV